MQVRSQNRNLRISMSKLVPLTDLVKNKDVVKVREILKFVPKKGARFLLQTLNAAIANAQNNYGLDEGNLYVKNVQLGQGATLKRWTPRSHGAADEIRKRTAQIVIILDERKPTASKEIQKRFLAKKKTDVKKAEVKEKELVKAQAKKPQDLRALSQKSTAEVEDQEKLASLQEDKKQEEGQKKNRGFLSKLFRRQAE
jgi:large subunit ribosomal protein L22